MSEYEQRIVRALSSVSEDRRKQLLELSHDCPYTNILLHLLASPGWDPTDAFVEVFLHIARDREQLVKKFVELKLQQAIPQFIELPDFDPEK